MITESKHTIATPPGMTIKEQLEDRHMTQKEFAARMGMSEKHISHLLNGSSALTTDTAYRLEAVLGIPASFWNNLEARYREQLVRVQNENEMEEDLKLAREYPYAEMANAGWVAPTRNLTEKVSNLRKFFSVARLSLLDSALTPGLCLRRQSAGERGNYALRAWAQKAKLDAASIHTGKINIEALTQNIAHYRHMTAENPSVFCHELQSSLAACGIALVFLPHIKDTFLHGATFYDGKKIVLGLTVRGAYSDKFWFSFFHELGHIIQNHIAKPEGADDNDELEADAFARDTLLPAMEYADFVKERNFSENSIMSFSERIGIHSGILVGRLQHDNHIGYNQYNGMRTKYLLNSV